MNTAVAERPITASSSAAAPFTLTDDQQHALDEFHRFLLDPVETIFVLRGFSGCGKSTLVQTILDLLPAYMRAAKLICPGIAEFEPELTATTNKAAENLGQITGHAAKTIHSVLGLRVQTDFKTNTTTISDSNAKMVERKLLFIDESSYIDRLLLGHILKYTRNCKIVFIGDPAQLAPVGSIGTPVFDLKVSGAALNEVVRQPKSLEFPDGVHPITALSTRFRETVETGEFFSFKPDGKYVVYLDRDSFNKQIEQEFTRPDWHHKDSKVLAWTNRCVVGFSSYIRNLAKGSPHFEEGDYAVCNSFLSVGRSSIKTDQMVLISKIEPDTEHKDVPGNWMTLDYSIRVFQPKDMGLRNARAKRARAEDDISLAQEIDSNWADLRAVPACTINKAQGSTYGAVFIDLDDVGKCNSGDQIARMLYVGISRARNTVFLTGDIC